MPCRSTTGAGPRSPTAILRRLTTLVFRETEVLKSRETLYEARDQSELTRSDVVLLGGLHAALGISRIGLLKNLRC
jgi:hypothetical protein